MTYRILLRPAAVRDLAHLPAKIRARIEQSIDELRENPRPVRCKKLVGFEHEWRLRVGSYRVLYAIEDGSYTVTIARVAHRREAYR